MQSLARKELTFNAATLLADTVLYSKLLMCTANLQCLGPFVLTFHYISLEKFNYFSIHKDVDINMALLCRKGLMLINNLPCKRILLH